MIKECDTLEKVDYGSANWSHEVADKVGYRRAFQEIHEILSLTEDK